MEQSVFEWLSGHSGGLVAIGMILGGIGTWAMNMKIVAPILQRAHKAEIAALETRIKAIEESFMREVEILRARITELEETEREYHKILKQHARLESERGS